MNEQNYGSLEACKRLVKAGIVLETDQYHAFCDGAYQGPEELYPDSIVKQYKIEEEAGDSSAIGWVFIPAPSMAEVWRELPYGSNLQKLMTNYARDQKENIEFEGDNPTDALIDLLIWTRKEGK